MPYLTYISDENLTRYTARLIEASRQAMDRVREDPYRNVIDPFSALIDAAQQGVALSTWMNQEAARQAQKGFQNALGDFHQNIIGSMAGWSNLGVGGSLDVINVERKIIAEVKNKYNSMNARSALSVYDNLSRSIDYKYSGYRAYLVEIVPKRPERSQAPFVVTERGTRRTLRQDIVRIDGASFYALASNCDNALSELYRVLPYVLEKLIEINPTDLTKGGEFQELFRRAYG